MRGVARGFSRVSLSVAVVAAIALVAPVVVVLAANNDPNQFRACISGDVNHTLTARLPGTTCRPDATPTAWSITGATGPQGDTGPTGAQGPQGATGNRGPRGF